jgi:hypothetical protein
MGVASFNRVVEIKAGKRRLIEWFDVAAAEISEGEST